MPYNVQLPNGVLIEGIPDDVSKDEARRRILKQFPDLEPEPTFAERAKTAFKRGVEQLPESLAGITLGAETGLGMTEAAGKKLREIKEEQAKAPAGAPGISFEDLEKIYGKDGAIAALQKLPAYITEQILQSAPSMAVPLAAGAAATPFGGPVVGALAGIGTYGLQQFGQFMQRQAEGAKTIEELEPGKAAVAAGVTAPLGFFVDRLTLGMSRLPTKTLGEGIMSELAKRAGATVAGRAATGAAIGVIAEAPTEMLEQMAERWQANLPLFDDAAIREYKEAAAGAAAVGGVGGAASRVLMGRPEEVQPPAAEVPLRAPQAPTPPEIPQITPEVSTLTPTEVEQVPPEVSQVTPLGAPLGGEIREMPGFAGPAGANQQMMEIARQRQAQAEAAAAKENAKRQKQVEAIEAQTFSSDPLADRMAKDRMIASLPQPPAQPPAQPLAVAAQPQAQPLAQPVAEPPPFIPISEPQKRPRGVAAPEFTLGEEEEIKSLRQGLQQVNAQIAEAKKQDAGSLFTALKGKLRPIKGGIKLTDIDQDKASLKQLYSKQEGGGRPLEDLVSDGALDDFLPFNNRSTSPGFDDIAAAETIMERLRTGEYKTEAYLEKMRALEEQKGNIKDELDRRLRTPEINKELAGLAGRMRQPAEVVGLEDLMEDARLLGIDVENIKENVFYRMPDATPEQYRGELTTALQGAISDSRLNRIDDILPQMNAPATPVNKQGAAMQKQLEGKTVNQAIDWLIKNAPNRFQALVAEKVKAMVNALQQRGVEMTFEVQGGDRRNVILFGANGVTQYTFTPDKTSVVVRLNGEPVVANQRGYPSGMQYDTAQHEFLHVATRTATRFLPPDHPVIKELNDLYKKVIAQYNKDARAGKLPPVLQKFYERGNNVLESMDELLTWGITDEEFQKYLDNINVGPKQTAFNKLVSLIREILGLAKPFETALERLIRTTDSILTMDVQQISDAMQVRGYSFGSPKVAKAIGEQQSLFARKGQKLLRDDLAVRKEGFYFNAKNSPLYQTRTAEEVGDFSQQEADKIVALEGRAKKIQDERRWVGKLKDGAWVGTRLDLAVFRVAKKAGLPPVLAVHEGSESKHTKGGFSKGELLRLVPHITLSNVRFNVMQGERERIAEGGEKGRMASADGQYMDVPPNFDGIEVSFNPTREHLFRDALGRAIKYADEVTVLKNRMYARGNIEYYGAEDVPPVPTQPSDSWIMGSGQDARQLQQRPAIVDEGDKVSKDQQKNLFDGQDVIQDSLFSRREGFFIDAKQSPLYQKRSAADVPVITQELANRALTTHAKGARVEGKGIELKPGDYIGARLDLPIRASSREVMAGGVPLQAIHMGNPTNYAREDGGFWDGKIAKYLPSVTMKNVKFRVDQTRREETAAGLKKRPMGSADGQFVRSDNPNFDGIELRFNPKREHLFVDAMGRSVKYADEVTVMGDRMYARGHVEYFGDEDFIQPAGVSPTKARVMSVEEALRQATPREQAISDFEDMMDMAGELGNRPPFPGAKKNSEGFWLSRNGQFTIVPVGGYGFSVVDLPTARFVAKHGFGTSHPNIQAIKAFELAREGKNPDVVRQKTLEAFEEAGVVRDDIIKAVDDMIAAAKTAALTTTAAAPISQKVQQAIQESSRTGKPLPPPIQESLFAQQDMEQPGIDRDKAFKKWFGNSKVVDAEGKPLVMYHGTSRDFSVFDRMKSAEWRRVSMDTVGSWFSSDPMRAAGYAGGEGLNVMPVYLSIQNPKVYRTFKDFLREMHAAEGRKLEEQQPPGIGSAEGLRKKLKAEGYDGIVFEQTANKSLMEDIKEMQDAIRQAKKEEYSVPRADRQPYTQKRMRLEHKLQSMGKELAEFGSSTEFDEHDVWIAFDPTQIKSAIGNRGTYSPTISDITMKQAAPVRTQTGEDAMEILSGIGRSVEPPEPGYVAKVRESWKNARDNPQATKEQALGSFRRWADQVETWAFSSDAALNNQIRRAIMESSLGNEEKIGTLLNASLSQTVHSDAIANLFLMEGNIKWDEEIHKWTGVKSENNIIKLSKQLDELAEKHGLTKEEAELIAHTAFEARRTASLIRENEQIEAQVEAIRAEAARIRAKSPVAASELSDKAAKLLTRKKIIHMTPEQINAGLTQFKLFPNLYQVADTWNGIRENALNVMVNTGLYSPQEADDLLSNADYVPFFREDQIEEGKGPKEFLRSLSVQADKRMKGSMKPVNDIFDNMVRWTQYAVNRGVRNRSALALVDTAAGLQLADRVKSAKDGDNVVRVWRNGKEEFYDMADPMFVSAFRGLESVAIPTIKVFSKVADVLRQSVVLYPGFALAQIPQDSFAAMFTSGLKPQYALRIPVLAAKEFLQTLRGKSKIHEELKNVGAAGVRDFTSAVIRNDAEVLAGLKKDKSFWAGVKRSLGNWAMAADNAVRQATYEAAMQQGLSKAEALEKAFEIFNVRRRGNSKMLAMAGQVIPFFNAYLAAQNVAYRTLTGVGTSPTQREAALKTLAATTGSVMVLSLIYAMMNGDDEDYLKKPTPTRDRLLMIPGTGISLPLRADLFILPKVLAEHTYMMVTDKGFSDSAKFRESMKSLLANAIFSPTPVPQAVKPITEAILNYDFFQQKPLVGVFQQRKELSRQFEDSTSEFARLLGKTEMISPIVADHLIRGMFGSFGGLVLYMTNPAIAAMSGRTRPDISMRDAIATIPNASAFVTKEYDVGLRKDFYALKEVTDRAAATMADLKNRSPQEIKEYLEDPVVKQRLGMAPVINRISNQLTQIRKQVNLVTNIEDPKFTDERKEEMIKKLRDQEYELLKNINLKKLREMAQV